MRWLKKEIRAHCESERFVLEKADVFSLDPISDTGALAIWTHHQVV